MVTESLLYKPDQAQSAAFLTRAALNTYYALTSRLNGVQIQDTLLEAQRANLEVEDDVRLPALLAALAESWNQRFLGSREPISAFPGNSRLWRFKGMEETVEYWGVLKRDFEQSQLARIVSDYNDRRKKLLNDKAPEFLVVTGINGCGKTTAIKILSAALNNFGVGFVQTKFPRPESPVSAFILTNLKEGMRMKAGATQLIFLSDLADFLGGITLNELVLSDRCPPVDGLVYSSEWGLIMSAAMLTQLEHVLNVIILDRSPVASFEAVLKRKNAPRVLESSADKLVNAQLKMYQIFSHMDGARIVNVDRPDGLNEYFVLNIVDEALIKNRILVRHLIKMGLSESEAISKADSLVWSFFNKVKIPQELAKILNS